MNRSVGSECLLFGKNCADANWLVDTRQARTKKAFFSIDMMDIFGRIDVNNELSERVTKFSCAASFGTSVATRIDR